MLTKFKLLLEDFLALLLCYDILTHLDLRLPTWSLLARPPGFPARVYKRGWEKVLFPEVGMDYPTRTNYRTKEASNPRALVSGPESESLLWVSRRCHLHPGLWGFQELITLHIAQQSHPVPG